MQDPNATQVAKTLEKEQDQVCKNETWTLIPAGKMKLRHQALGKKWVYKLKQDIDGNIACFKARWVVKDYLQQFRVDFDQTFTAIITPMAFGVIFVIATFFDLDINQMDVKTAFLYGLIN